MIYLVGIKRKVSNVSISSRNLIITGFFCLLALVIGIADLLIEPGRFVRSSKAPIVVVATFYQGMTHDEVESKITRPFKQFFALGGDVDRVESRSVAGVSLIKIFFPPGSDPDAALVTVTNLAKAELPLLPAGTVQPVILKFDASNLPDYLSAPEEKGLSETELRDLLETQGEPRIGTRINLRTKAIGSNMSLTHEKSPVAYAAWSDFRKMSHKSKSL